MKKTVKLISALLVLVLSITALSSCGSNSDSLISFKMSSLNPRLNRKADNVVKIEEIHIGYGNAPNTREASYYTENPEVIDKYLKWFGDIELSFGLPRLFVLGGGSCRYVFTFDDGTTKEIYTNQELYYSGLLCFDMHTQQFPHKDDMRAFYRFNVRDGYYSIYTCGDNPELVKESDGGARNLRFVSLTDATKPEAEPTHYLVASFGRVYFYSDTLCYIDKGDNEIVDREDGYYELYETTLAELMK